MVKRNPWIGAAVLAVLLCSLLLMTLRTADKPAAWRKRITKVTAHYGMTAEISDCRVVLDDKPLEGKLLLAALGSRLFVNEHQVFPHGPEKKAQGYIGSIASELSLIYTELVNNRGLDHWSAILQMQAFASGLSGVWKAEDEVVLYFEKSLTPYPNSGVTIMFSSYQLDPEHAAEVIRPCKIKRRHLLIEDRFKEILRSVTSGKSLVIRPGEEYSFK